MEERSSRPPCPSDPAGSRTPAAACAPKGHLEGLRTHLCEHRARSDVPQGWTQRALASALILKNTV